MKTDILINTMLISTAWTENSVLIRVRNAVIHIIMHQNLSYETDVYSYEDEFQYENLVHICYEAECSVYDITDGDCHVMS